MKISLAEFCLLDERLPVVIHSLECALYQASVVFPEQERLLTDENGATLRCYSIGAMRSLLREAPVASLLLRQRSAYDEMVGQPPRLGSNLLEVPLGLAD